MKIPDPDLPQGKPISALYLVVIICFTSHPSCLQIAFVPRLAAAPARGRQETPNGKLDINPACRGANSCEHGAHCPAGD
jgi:hypothetical protein